MEDTDLYEWSRRPGFSIYCSQPMSDSEIVNQFYSDRLLNGTVVPWVDTNQRWAKFNTTEITTIAAKTTINQGYPSTVGNMTYFSDGAAADLYKFDSTNLSAWGLAAPTITPISSGLGFWQPYTRYAIGDAILDTNGDVEVVSAILIPNGAFESPSFETTLAYAGSLSQTWEFDGVNGGYFVSTGYRLVQQTNGNSGTNTVTITFPNAVTIGDSIVLIFGQGSTNFSPAVVSVTDNLGNTYTQQATGTGTYHGGGGNNFISTGWVWTAPVTVGGTCTVTVETSGSTGAPLFILGHEFLGLNASATTSASGFGINVGSQNTGTVSFSGTEFVLSSLLLFSTGGTSTPSGYVVGTSNTSGEWQLYDAYAGTTSLQSPTWTIPAANGQALGITVVFPITSLTTGYSPYLFLGSFDFNIPSGATILGIQVSIPKWDAGLGAVVDQSVKLVIGGAVAGTEHASGTPWTSSGYSAALYGGPADTWGLSLTAAELNANGISGFGIAISASITSTTGGSVVPEVGYVAPNAPTVTVYYKQSSGFGGPGVSGANEPIWPTNISSVVNDGGLTWTNYGQIQTWYPVTGYPTPVVILDINGNLQLSTYVANPIPEWNDSDTYTVGEIVYFSGSYWVSIYNGSNTGIVPSTLYATTGSTTVPYWALTTTPLVTGTIAPVWNTTVGGKTIDGSYTWTNIGQGSLLASFGYSYVYGYRTIYGHLTTSSPYSNNTGAILGPMNATITSYAIASNIVTFTGDNNFLPGNVFEVTGLSTGIFLNEQALTVISAVPSETFPLTAVAVNSDVLTITAVNNLIAGQQVTFSGVSTATFLNGITVTVLSSGLSSSQFEADFTHANYGPADDSGNVTVIGSYTAAFTYPNTSVTLDSGAAIPLISTLTGAGTASPLCNSIASITSISVTANIVTVTAANNFQPGLWVTLTGLTNATFLNNQQLQVISVDQPIGVQNTYFQVYFETPNYATTADTGIATFNAIEVYRTSDGGGIYLFAGAVTNPGTGAFIFNDFVTDANLDIELVAPLAHQNDPPPGAPGSTIITTGTVLKYWQGRLWQANGNYVYFDAGPDCTNGVPEESWPPGNRFQFAGPVMNMEPTADGVGLIVFLADRYAMILGGPETISFYPTDFLSNFGISNPNAMFRDGSVIGQFTTQKQYFDLVGKEKQEIGEHVADYLTENFTADTTYITMHRNGLDVGVFLSNGTDQVLRYGSNIGAWSVPAYPACGAGALRSIETSVGLTNLMLASPTGGITISVGLVNPTSGITTGLGTAWIAPSNITVGSPTSYATVIFSAAGSSETLRASGYPLTIPVTAVVQGVQVVITGKQTDILGDLNITITPTNPVVGAETHTFAFGTSNTTVTFGGSADLWGMDWSTPGAFNAGLLSFDLVATYTGASTPEVFVSEVKVTITYQNPGNYLYARDVNSWGDCGAFGENNGTPYSECNVIIGSITLSQPGARMFPLQHIVGYFDAVGTLNNGGPSQPDIWILPNEISTVGSNIPFIQLTEVLQEPPEGQNKPSGSLLALRWPLNMMNSYWASQFIHHLQVKVQFEPENAPNTLKAISFKEEQD